MALRAFGMTLVVAWLVALHPGASAQTQPGQPARYLAPLAEEESALASVPPEAYGRQATPGQLAALRRLDSPLQRLGTTRSWVGDTDGAIAAFDARERALMRPRPDSAAQFAQVADAHAEDAIKAIVEQARSKQVVLINEAHHVPMHRAFAQKLAAELRKIGYSYLACETFFSLEGDMSGSAPGQVTTRTGYYTKDPVFAEFVNSALADGWKLVSYEPAMESTETDFRKRQDEREQGEARNLVERILARDKNARVLVYVGYGHLQKMRPGRTDGLVLMGEYLRRMSGVATLHVDQRAFHAHPDRADEGPLYPLLLDKFPSREPFVLRSPDGSFPVLAGWQGTVDMQVIFPRYAMRDGRPEWLQTLAGRAPREIPSALLPKQGRRVIKAFRTTDRPDAIPADVVLVEAGRPAPKLMLPTGEFRYAVED
jgi:hypothetical protein